MTTIKTAISIDELLFQRAEALAAELHISRSRLFVLAMEEYIQRRQNRRLLQEINEAYEDAPDAEELDLLRQARQHHRRLTEGDI
jgi:metal-responsive CopG/Arc/MetJ family transcriptional regulator